MPVSWGQRVATGDRRFGRQGLDVDLGTDRVVQQAGAVHIAWSVLALDSREYMEVVGRVCQEGYTQRQGD